MTIRVTAGGKHTLGFTYLGVLFAVVFMGIALGLAGQIWSTLDRRIKEQQLLFIGSEFSRAIANYYDSTPGPVKQLPRSLKNLLQDPRYPTVRRYLRKIYVDPMTVSVDWGIIAAPDGEISGVYSKSQQIPLKRANFPADYADFSDAKHYSDWRFTLVGAAGTSTAGKNAATSPAAIDTQPGIVQSTAVAPAGAPSAPTPPPPIPNDPQACMTLARDDALTCDTAQQRGGAEAGAACRTSAQERQASCLAGQSWPAMVIR